MTGRKMRDAHGSEAALVYRCVVGAVIGDERMKSSYRSAAPKEVGSRHLGHDPLFSPLIPAHPPNRIERVFS